MNMKLEGCFWLVQVHNADAKEFPRIWEFLTNQLQLLVDSISRKILVDSKSIFKIPVCFSKE